MKLQTWLKREGASRADFAKRVEMSPASITALCNDDTAWRS
jgi:3,4-dihydroxy 2-butanone 4-phosphate synthase/GTP cyclohydrolase II